MAGLQQDGRLGRLKVTTTMGGTDSDGDYDSGSEIGERLAAASIYPDDRSDDKGAEPEGAAVGRENGSSIAFVGAARAEAVLVFDVSNPSSPAFLQVLPTGDAPEGIIFIPAHESPVRKSLLVVSSEDNGIANVFQGGTVL